MDWDHAISLLTHVLTFIATLAGIIGGTIRSLNKAEIAFANMTADFFRKDSEAARARELAALGREDKLRGELRVMHHEYEAARQNRMVKQKTTASAAVFIDGEGTILDVSENIAVYVGWRPSELIGQCITMLTPEACRAKHIAGIKAASRSGKKVIRGEDSIDSRVELLRRDGTLAPVTIAIVGGGTGKEARYTGTIRMRSGDSATLPALKS